MLCLLFNMYHWIYSEKFPQIRNSGNVSLQGNRSSGEESESLLSSTDSPVRKPRQLPPS